LSFPLGHIIPAAASHSAVDGVEHALRYCGIVRQHCGPVAGELARVAILEEPGAFADEHVSDFGFQRWSLDRPPARVAEALRSGAKRIHGFDFFFAFARGYRLGL
jgi:hypothetical protein